MHARLSGSHCALTVARFIRWLLAGVLCLCATFAAWAEQGYFSVRDARTELKDGVYRLDANIDFRFSDEALDALHSGLPFVINIEVKVERPRNYLWADTVAELRQRYRIQFHALSDRYVVHNLNTDTRHSYVALDDALQAFGTLRDFPMLDRRLLDLGHRYRAGLRATLDIEALPTPMRLWAYVSDQWQLDSEWYQWPLLP